MWVQNEKTCHERRVGLVCLEDGEKRGGGGEGCARNGPAGQHTNICTSYWSTVRRMHLRQEISYRNPADDLMERSPMAPVAQRRT